MTTSRYPFNLIAPQRAAGLAHVGTDAAHGRLFAKLDRGEAISVAVLGASVAQNGGCMTQPGQRCMLRNGRVNDTLSWGEPRVRQFKGFLVRWFEWLETTWPQPHTLYNAARDASSLSSLTPCLASHLPSNGADLLIVEAGSMFLSHTPAMIEQLLRAVASMRAPPAVVFATVHVWCTFGGSIRKKTDGFNLRSLPSRKYNFFQGGYGALANASEAELTQPEFIRQWQRRTLHANSTTDIYWKLVDGLEDGINDLCRQYRVSCVSMRDALSSGFYGGWPGFEIGDIAGDCLHPSHGRLGTEYMTDMLVHWTSEASVRARAGRVPARTNAVAPTATAMAPRMAPALERQALMLSTPIESSSALPSPLFQRDWERPEGEVAACYALKDAAATYVDHSHGEALIPWRTATCSEAAILAATKKSTPGRSMDKLMDRLLSLCDAPNATFPTQCTTPGSRAALPAATTSPLPTLPTWSYCPYDEQSRKLSPGVSAFRAGATLLVDLPTSWLPRSNASQWVPFNLTLQYMVSWQPGMGTAWISCLAQCTCGEHSSSRALRPDIVSNDGVKVSENASVNVGVFVSARRLSSVRNATIFVERTIPIRFQAPSAGQRAECLLAIRMQEGAHQDAREKGAAVGQTAAAVPEGEARPARFKLRGVVLSTLMSPCHRKGMAHFLEVRNGLKCAVDSAIW